MRGGGRRRKLRLAQARNSSRLGGPARAPAASRRRPTGRGRRARPAPAPPAPSRSPSPGMSTSETAGRPSISSRYSVAREVVGNGPTAQRSLLRQCVHEARLAGIDLARPARAAPAPPARGCGGVALARGAQLVIRERQPTGVEVDGGAADFEHEQPRRVGAQPIGEHARDVLSSERAAVSLAGGRQRIDATTAPERQKPVADVRKAAP